ncbi:unnamed protein product [Clavelina lepadiformis]|uniref:Uncharacterized protein n=1 Tax=Clavelina lepadiformis TaxID=159417 RepID=A0ABP0GWX6_CLALP
MTENKRRKIENEGRIFNREWTIPKEYNLRRHFESNHPNLAELDATERNLKADSLLKNLCSERNFFKRPVNVTATRVSYEIDGILRHSAVGIKYAQQIKFLIEEFNSRLSLSSEEKLQLKIIENPFLIDPEEAPPHLQMEIFGRSDGLRDDDWDWAADGVQLQNDRVHVEDQVRKKPEEPGHLQMANPIAFNRDTLFGKAVPVHQKPLDTRVEEFPPISQRKDILVSNC